MHRLSIWARELRASYWFVPGLMSVAAAVLATLLVLVDAQLASRLPAWLRANQPDGARALLSAVAGSSITVAGVVFSVAMVVLSLTSQQFGPRLLENFMRDTGTQAVFGTLLATFLYCLLVLRVIRGGDSAFVPHLALLVALALALASVAALVYVVHHVSRSIQIGNIIAYVAHDLDGFVATWERSDRAAHRAADDAGAAWNEDANEGPVADPAGGGRVLRAERSGYVAVEGRMREELVELARRHGARLELLRPPGSFVTSGVPLLRVYAERAEGADGGGAGGALERRVRRLVRLRPQRSQSDDVRLRLDQMVQVALRALSPSLSDPHTAETCLEHLMDGLRKIALAGGPPDAYRDRDGAVRMTEPRQAMADLFRDALGPVRRMAADDLRVALKLFETIARLRRLPLDRDALAALRSEADLHGAAATARAEGDDRRRLEAAWRRAVADAPPPPGDMPDIERGA